MTEKLLALGIESTWNDNNEYNVDDECAICHGFGRPMALKLIRPVQAMLMVRASLEAQQAHKPKERPWLISRSGMPGTQRYAQTWSGDNYTSWHTLKYNVSMGVGLSLSGFFNTGHDVGGFAGPAPEPELLVRWVQNGVFHPRFTIHSVRRGAVRNITQQLELAAAGTARCCSRARVLACVLLDRSEAAPCAFARPI